jgi:hypothetical protein
VREDFPMVPGRGVGVGGLKVRAVAIVASSFLVAACSARGASTGVFEQATPDGLLHVLVTLDPAPATCARPVVMTVIATTPPGHVVDFGPEATGREHLRLQTATQSDRLSDDGRMMIRSLRIAWLPDLPGRVRVPGRRIAARPPDGKRCAVTVPDIPVEIAAVIPRGQKAELRDIAPLAPLPVRRGRTIGICALSCGLLLVFLAGLARCLWRRAGCPAPVAEMPK